MTVIIRENFELQVRNCFTSILDAIENYAVDRLATLSKNDINGLRLLEFNNFDTRLGNIEDVQDQILIGSNKRYDLKVSGEYSDNSFTTTLMIADKLARNCFGFKVKISADLDIPKIIHIIANIPLFGVQCVINYNPETNFYVYSIRPPFNDDDLEMEKTIAAKNECALICLEVNFIHEQISYEVFDYEPESPSDAEETSADDSETANAVSSFFNNIEELYHIAPKHLKSTKVTTDKKVSIVLDTAVASNLFDALMRTNLSVSEVETVTYENIAGIENLNFTCSRKKGLNGKSGETFGVHYTISLSKSFDLTVSGEYSNGSITVPVMLTHKPSGYSFGFEVALDGIIFGPRKNGLYLVIKIPGTNVEFVLRINLTPGLGDGAAGLGGLIVAIIRRNNDDRGNGGGSSGGNGSGGNDNVYTYSDKKDAAACKCSLIYLEVDFHSKKVTQKVYDYETISSLFHPVKTTIIDSLPKELPKRTNFVDDILKKVNGIFPALAAGGFCVATTVAAVFSPPTAIATAGPLALPVIASLPRLRNL